MIQDIDIFLGSIMTEIIYLHGNLLDTDIPIILHGCNAQGVMGSGVAKAIRAKYPQAYQIYKITCDCAEDKKDLLGTIVWFTHNHDVFIGNAITQEYYGRSGKCYIDYNAINNVMVEANSFAESWECPVVAMPFIGAGLGGGSWRRISAIIEEAFTYATPVVYSLDGTIPNN
jgi:O-acetyl-ADP-ribose deacetylase (regulator of RNase III)